MNFGGKFFVGVQKSFCFLLSIIIIEEVEGQNQFIVFGDVVCCICRIIFFGIVDSQVQISFVFGCVLVMFNGLSYEIYVVIFGNVEFEDCFLYGRLRNCLILKVCDNSEEFEFIIFGCLEQVLVFGMVCNQSMIVWYNYFNFCDLSLVCGILVLYELVLVISEYKVFRIYCRSVFMREEFVNFFEFVCQFFDMRRWVEVNFL